MEVVVSSLRSRVSRRIFLLFFLAAFVPIFLISVISYQHINSQLREQTEQQLHNETRTVGHALFDRLLTIQAILGTITIPVDLQADNLPDLNKQYLSGKLEDINLVSPTGESIVLMGEKLPIPEIDPEQYTHLAGGNSIVGLIETDSRNRLVIVTYRATLNSRTNEAYLIVATPDPQYLYNLGVDEPQIACALTISGSILGCSSKVIQVDLDKIDFSREVRRDFQDWQFFDTAYTLHIWDLFLGAQFKSDHIGIMVATPNSTILGDINSFNTIFPKTLLITGLLVVMLSISSIRKNLNPLNELLLGTNRIMNGEFKTPVKIDSNDEFSSLAGSFNNMALRIDDQIQTLTMMSRIDRMILASHDAKQIIHVLIEYGHTAFSVNHIAIFSINSDDNSNSTISYNIDEAFSEIRTEAQVMDKQQLAKFDVKSSHIWLDENDTSQILQPLRNYDDRFFLVLPLKVKSKITGMICLGNREPFQVGEAKLDELRDLADRVAVALSNAAWEDKLYYQAHYDAVTGLPNRYLLKDRLDQAVAKTIRAHTNIAVLLIDLDQFKAVNDSMGHKVGDELLVQVAQRMSSCVRSSDTLARFGGDEFVILMDTEEDEKGIIQLATQLARRIQNHFTTPFIMQGREIHISASIGIAVCPANAQTVDDLLKQADTAMYHAKNEGRGQFRFFDQSLNSVLLKRLGIEQDLRHALERNEFELMYQPKAAANGGRIIGVEALLRWRHEKRGFVQPQEFIPIAEDTGLINEIGTWVMRSASEQSRIWLDKGYKDFHVSVNVSGVQFRKPGFDQLLQQILTDTGLPPAMLEIEITESVTIEDFDKTIKLLDKLREIGVGVSIDDFGTGYSSMSYLNQFKIDKLKIDKSFVDGIPEFESSMSIANAIIALAHSLGFTVVAEGVEKLEQYAFLVNSGVDEIQGFYVSRPLPLAEFEKFYQQHEAKLSSNIKKSVSLN